LVLGKPEGFTKEELRSRRQREMFNYNMLTFGNTAIGIHGKELPKFSQSQYKEYWKLGSSYKETANITSSLKLRQERTLWKKDIPSDEIPTLNAVHVAKNINNKITDKVQHINSFNERVKRTSIKAKEGWTEGMLKRSVYDLNPRERASGIKYEQLPLPSSFTKSGIFPGTYNKEK